MEGDEEIEAIRRRIMEDMTSGRKTQEIQEGPVVLSDANFDSFVNGAEVAFVDFWAPWCGPCRMVAPVVEKLAGELKGKVSFGKLNVDDNPVKSGQFRVMSIPTMMIFHKGKAVDAIIGAVPRAEIMSRLGRFIGS